MGQSAAFPRVRGADRDRELPRLPVGHAVCIAARRALPNNGAGAATFF
jgi:hypothetical protein